MNDHPHDALDAAIRAHHQTSLEALSPRVRAQLAQRRHASMRGTAARRAPLLPYATAALAAVAALALGMQFTAFGPASPDVGGVVAATAPGAAATMLDEDPEFYAWLATADAQLVAKE